MTANEIHLKQDGIKEALFEIRFDTPVMPEAVIGRLTDAKVWNDFEPTRLPTADLPQQMRIMDSNLRFTPSYELVKFDSELIRIGPNSLSYHRMAPYPGWEQHEPKLKQVVETLFSTIEALTPLRLGFRYSSDFLRPVQRQRGLLDQLCVSENWSCQYTECHCHECELLLHDRLLVLHRRGTEEGNSSALPSRAFPRISGSSPCCPIACALRTPSRWASRMMPRPKALRRMHTRPAPSPHR